MSIKSKIEEHINELNIDYEVIDLDKESFFIDSVIGRIAYNSIEKNLVYVNIYDIENLDDFGILKKLNQYNSSSMVTKISLKYDDNEKIVTSDGESLPAKMIILEAHFVAVSEENIDTLMTMLLIELANKDLFECIKDLISNTAD